MSTEEYYAQDPGCQPVLTPADCGPHVTSMPTVPVTPAEPSQAPHGDPMPEFGPSLPGIDPDGEWFDWLNMPDWTWDGVVDGTVVTGAGLVFVLLLTLLLLVPSTLLAWTPAKMRNWTMASLLALPGSAIVFDGLQATAPLTQFHQGATELLAGNPVHGLLLMSVLLVPASWLAATLAVTDRRVKAATTGFRSPAATERALHRQAQREQRAAARLSRYRLPFSTGGLNPHPVIGRLAVEHTQAPAKSRARALMGRTETRLIVPWIKMNEHGTSVASSGKGKSTLMNRALISWFVTGWQRHRQWWRTDRPGRPLVLVIDCNGGPDSRKAANRLMPWFKALGVPEERIGLFPDRTGLDLWSTPNVDDLRSILSAMVSGGSVPTSDTEKYFHEIRETLIHLIVDAPAKVVDGKPVGENPPRSWFEFLARFDVHELAKLWGGVIDDTIPWSGVPGVDAEIASTKAGKQPVMDSARAEFGNLYRALGDSFDGDKSFTDFDVLYIVLEGIKAPDRARAQFAALGCMLEQLADRQHGRQAILAVDEFSAVSDGKTRAKAWVERLRKAGISTWWFAQSWNGLGHDDDAREALVTAASGGSLLGGQQRGEKLAETYGTRKGFDLSRKLIGGSAIGDEGNVQSHDKFLVDPNRLRSMGKGDIVHVSDGVARFGRVSPLDERQLAGLRPLPGLGRLTAPDTDTSAAPVAPVIDLTKRRMA
ncbi:hypothetical protein [Nocardia testacea]|uniref:hypothetical protein n=1 Tax=Nocardia testacea TaxID=248551 RepID=UPI0005851C87|nr:hypothetical protein [Nocardia testacea]